MTRRKQIKSDPTEVEPLYVTVDAEVLEDLAVPADVEVWAVVPVA